MIMNKLGIECYAAKNTPKSGEEDKQHIWNVVKIEGNYYHVDCTSDDPVIYDSDSDDYYLANTVKNYVSHENLLVSSEQLIKNDGGSTQHAGLKIIPSFMDIECNSKRFDNAAYRKITSPIFNYDGNWYAVTCDLPRKIVNFNSDFSDYTVTATSESGDNYCYKGTDEKVTNLLEIGTNVGAYVYFNDPQYVYKYDFLTNKFSQVILFSRMEDFDLYEPNCYAQGCYISSDGKLEVFVTYDFVTEDDEEYYFTDYDNEYFQCYCNDFQLGDLTKDGTVTANDLIKLKEYILTGQSDVANIDGLADLTRNNTVDLLDFVKMKHIIAQNSSYTIESGELIIDPSPSPSDLFS